MLYYKLNKVLTDIDICVEHSWKSAYLRRIMQPEKSSNLFLIFYIVYAIIFLRVYLTIFFRVMYEIYIFEHKRSNDFYRTLRKAVLKKF